MAAKYIHSLNLMLRGSNLIFVLKLITYPSQGDDIVPVRAKAVPEVLYMGIYGPVIAEEIIAPDVREQMCIRDSWSPCPEKTNAILPICLHSGG